ncbi:DUF2069 domain-containing protein [Marinimicrobium alkaliphilum]|uniref:DUF2069 domain-containing protein n=1 Tax=Marinimicrobium alkaliphilum TaxID=2202654 RepID=UPI000DB99E1D|nr:DUF2069 domain-containing protein [Marinimicrobium alkaliphilum]
MTPTVSRKRRIAQAITTACYGLLLFSFVIWNLTFPGGSFKLWVVQTLPLAVILPGLIRDHYRVYSWLCFIILVYFIWAVTNVMSPVVHVYGYIVLVLSVIVFVGAMMTSRWKQREMLDQMLHSEQPANAPTTRE